MHTRTARSFVNALLVATLLLTMAAPAWADQDSNAGEILVKFRPGTPGQAVAEAHRQNGGQPAGVIAGRAPSTR